MLVLTLGSARSGSRKTLFSVPVGTGRESAMTVAVAFSLVRNACVAPVKLAKPTVTGKPAGEAPPDDVPPVTYALPPPSTWMASPSSARVPPRKVE